MKSKMLCLLIAILAIGCASTYKYNELQPVTTKLDGAQGVLISTPQDGRYGNIPCCGESCPFHNIPLQAHNRSPHFSLCSPYSNNGTGDS